MSLMKAWKKVTGVLLAAAIMFGGLSMAAEASGTYTETMLPPPVLGNGSEQWKPLGISALPDGTVDFFIQDKGGVGRRSASNGKYMQYHSVDGGNTWEKIDLEWLNQLSAEYAKEYLGQVTDICMAKDGTYYVLMATASATADEGNVIHGCSVFSVLRVKDGVPKAIPNIALRTSDLQYHFAYVKDGKVAVLGDADTIGPYKLKDELNSKFLVFDETTGALEQETATLPPVYFGYRCYANGFVYATEVADSNEAFSLLEYDAGSGALKRSIPIPGPRNISWISVCGKSDGTLYVTSKAGLFRLDPGSSSFAKLLDGASCRFGIDPTYVRQAVCLPDGTVFVLMNENERLDSSILCRYSPESF